MRRGRRGTRQAIARDQPVPKQSDPDPTERAQATKGTDGVPQTSSVSRLRRLLPFFFQAEDGIRDLYVTRVQTCALPISRCRSPVESGLYCVSRGTTASPEAGRER